MARVTIEDCLDHCENRFALVMMSSRRTRQLMNGARPLVEGSKNKEAITALREIAGGKVYLGSMPDETMPMQIAAPEVEEARKKRKK